MTNIKISNIVWDTKNDNLPTEYNISVFQGAIDGLDADEINDVALSMTSDIFGWCIVDATITVQ